MWKIDKKKRCTSETFIFRSFYPSIYLQSFSFQPGLYCCILTCIINESTRFFFCKIRLLLQLASGNFWVLDVNLVEVPLRDNCP